MPQLPTPSSLCSRLWPADRCLCLSFSVSVLPVVGLSQSLPAETSNLNCAELSTSSYSHLLSIVQAQCSVSRAPWLFKLCYVLNLVQVSVTESDSDFWPLQSCFCASIVQKDSLLYPLEASCNIAKSIKPFWNTKQRQTNTKKQPSLQARLGE